MTDKKKPKLWHVGEDDVGRPMLKWDAGSSKAAADIPDDEDPLAQTFNYLKRLDVSNLELEHDADEGSRDPYDSDG